MELLSPHKLCDHCGSSLDLDILSGFCPGCLLATVLETETETVTGSRIDDYELLNEVARGGMGIVYRARQRTPSRVVALKMILPAHLNSSGAITRFRAEAEAAASLEHESILPIYAFGEHDGAPFYSMKFAEGGTLSARVASYRDQPRKAATLIAKLARAVAYAHEHGILHRDLKPANVLFDAADKPYVSDFGLAKWLERECDLTQTLAILGTPFYMAPEQATDSRSVTATADVYSLGAILYHLLTGHPPVSGETPMEVLHRAAEQKPTPIRPANHRVPPDLETICLKCLEKEPASRYESAGALADDLERFGAGQTIRARPAGLTSRAWRSTRRNPFSAVLGVTVAALLIVLCVLVFTGRTSTDGPPSSPRIAILPFATNATTAESKALADDLQEQVLRHLRKISGLIALSSRTVVQAGEKTKDMGTLRQTIGASHVLQGSVTEANGRLLVSAELIDTRTAAPIWKNKFEGERPDIFNMEKAMAEQLAVRLKGKLSAPEKAAIDQDRVHDLEAYELYLHARSLTRSYSALVATVDENRPKAIELLEKAIARDPQFALAYALLSETQAETNWAEDVTPEQIAKAKTTAEMAVRAGPQVPEAHLVLGSFFYPMPYQKGRGGYDYFRDRQRGLEEWRTAERLAPGNAAVLAQLSVAAADRGDWEEAVQKLDRARQVEPLEPTWALALAQLHLAFRRYAEAEQIADGMIAQLPPESASEFWDLKRDIALARGETTAAALANERTGLLKRGGLNIYHRMAVVALMQHHYAEAAALLESIPEKARTAPNVPASRINPFFRGSCNYALGLARRAQGEKEKAQAAFAEAEAGFREWLRRYPEEPDALGMLPLCLAGQGRRNDALREITHALETFPLSRDPLQAVKMRDFISAAYAWTGDRELGLELLQEIVRLPNGPPAGILKLNPRWDDLRADPRFEQIIAEAEKPILF
jgi:serine/threonine protein kinase/tetratricopeptide (TPR) repeat protein